MFQVVDPKPSSRRFSARLVLTSPRLHLLVALGLLWGAPALRADNFYTLTPCRVFDSRATPPPLQGGVEKFIPVAGVCGVPAGATAVSLNITVTNATAGGDMEIGRGDATLPDPATTRLSFQPNKTRANNGLVQIATDGVGGVVKGVKARAAAAGTTTVDLILDVNGYFFPGPPVAVDDHYDAEKDTVLNVGAATGVTSNDTLGGGAIASYGATTGSEQTTIGAATPTSAGGSITLNADGSFSYTPPSGAVLIDDTFKYVLQNLAGTSSATVTISVGKASQTIAFTSTAPSGATVGGPTYNVTATATSGLAVTFTIDASAASVCTLAGSTVSFIGVGSCVIDADQAGDANYQPAPQVQQSFAVGKGDQTISFTSTAPSGATVGGPTYNVTATATSGLPVALTIDASATSVCTIAGSTVSFIAVGTCVIDADQPGDANWNAAPQVQQSFAVGKGDQTITFTSSAPGSASVGGPTYTVTATVTSGLTVTFAIDASATSVCSIAGSTVSFLTAGTCVIDANQAGDANWNAAPQAQQSFAVGKAAQTISFTSTAPVGATVGGPTYNVTATATSGLTVSFTIDATATSVCTIAGSTVSFIGVGTCVVDADQPGDANYNAAPQVQQSFAVAKGDQTISFTSTAPAGAKVGGPTYTVTATATSGLTVAFTIDASATSVCSIAGSTVSFLSVGTCVINANQPGDANWNAAPQVQQSFVVAKGDQTISFTSTAPASAKVGGPTYTVTATATSGLAVTFSIDASSASVCSIAGSTVSFIGAGTCVVNADQAGNANWNAAPQAQQSFTVAKGDQTISFTSTAPAAAKVGGATYTPTATATSGLAVVFTIDASASSVCSIAGGTVSFIGAGTCVINANQPGDSNWNPAPQVQQSFGVTKQDQTISFTSTPPSPALAGGPTYNVTATATSGLTVTFSIDGSATGVCSIVGSTVSFTTSGTCVINANQAGNATYNAAPQVQQSFLVVKQDQTISFTSTPPNPGLVGTPYTVTATATSGLAVTFTIDATATSVCSISGSTVTFITGGTCLINANQAGNAIYNPAPQVQQSVVVNNPPQVRTDPPFPKENFDTVGNTQFEFKAAQALSPSIFVVGNLKANFTDGDGPLPLSVLAIAGGPTTNGGTVDVNTTGEFTFTPKAGDTAVSDSFTYQVTDGAYTIPRTVTINLKSRVWYVKNDAAAGGLGRSNDPFDTLAEAQTASLAGDYIFVYGGDLTTTGQAAGIVLKANQKLHGEAVGLTVVNTLNGVANPTLVPATPANRPKIDNPAVGGNAVGITNIAGVEVRGLSIAANANAINVTTTAAGTGGATISDNVITGSGQQGIKVLAGGTGGMNVTIQTNSVSATGNAIDIQTTAGATVLDVNNDTVLSAANGIVISGAVTTITNFANNAVSGTTGGSGISINGATFDQTPGGTFQTVGGGTTVIGASGNGVGGSGVVLTSVSGDLAFADIDIFADGGAGLRASGTTAYTGSAGFRIGFPGVVSPVADVTAVGGPAVDLTTVAMNNFIWNNVVDTNSASTGLALNSVTGTFTAASGSSINNSTGTGFQVGSSNATITYAGTITVTTGKGVDLTTNTGSTISFSGTLSLSSGSNTAFNASGGGTVTATDTASTLTTTTGTALNVTSTTIGSGGLKFRSISAGTVASGPTNGIVLNTTGASGSLTVIGSGGAGTGGTIQKTGGDGISLTSTFSPSFDRMVIKDTVGSGIQGTTVTNFTLTNSSIDNSGTGGGVDESNVAFNAQAAGTENNLAGTVTITGNSLTNARYHGVDIFNFAGTISNATISSNTITSSTSSANSLGSGIRFVAFGSAGGVASITKATVATNTITNFPIGSGVLINCGNANAAGPGGTCGVPNSVNTISVTGNRTVGQASPNQMGSNAIAVAVTGGNGASRSQANFDVSNNGTVALPLVNFKGVGVGCSVFGNSTATCNVTNNVMVANNTLASRCIAVGVDRTLAAGDTPDLTATITNNVISQCDGNGIFTGALNSNGTSRLKIQNNSVAAPLTGVRPGIRIDSGTPAAAGTNTTVCLNISGNTSAGSGGTNGIGMRKEGTAPATNAFGVNGMAATASPGVETFVDGLNPAGNGTLLISATSGFSNCSLP